MSSERHAELIAEIATLTAENETLRRRVQELEALLADKEAPEKAAAADTEDTEATQKTRDAIRCLDAAQAATGSATFLSAGDLIADGSAKSAAVVLTSIMRSHELCDAEASEEAVGAAQRHWPHQGGASNRPHVGIRGASKGSSQQVVCARIGQWQ